MRPIAVEALLLLRAGVPEATLRPGQSLVARVLDRTGDHGRLSLAGVVLEAELPETTQAGDTLRLRVAEVSPERLVLRLEPPPPLVVPGAALPLPGGAVAHVRPVADREAGGASGAEGEQAAVAVTYESPRLGPIDLRLALHPDALRCQVRARSGAAAAETAENLGELQRALEGLGVRSTVHVEVIERHDPFDSYA